MGVREGGVCEKERERESVCVYVLIQCIPNIAMIYSLHHNCTQVEVPLNTAMKLIKLSADRYDTVFSVTKYVSIHIVGLGISGVVRGGGGIVVHGSFVCGCQTY